VTDLRSAINRIGYNMVRSASISFAMAEIRNSNKLAGIEHHLEALWRRSTQVAAFAFVLARTCTHVNPDEAMLTGMMHGIGKLYVLTRATAHPELFANAATLTQIIEDWHPSIGKAILENWGFAEAVAQAVGDQLDHSRTQMQPPDLSDIIAAAVVMAEYSGDAAALETALKELPEPKRLGLNQARTAAVMRESAAEVSALTDALGG
jgi:HD-like signal output (HDOD) protein